MSYQLHEHTGHGQPARAGHLSPPVRAAIVTIVRPWAGWAVRSAIAGRDRSRADPAAGRFTRADLRRLLRAAWAKFDQMEPGLPPQPTAGSRLNVLLACLTLALFQALTDEGTDRGYAIELTGDACWKIYAQWGQIPRLAAALRTRDPARRMRHSVNAFLRFPFGQPGYLWRDVPEPAGRSLDMLRCPVAGYLAAHEAADLATGSWCNLDFQLARTWGGTLERHHTLAAGDQRCDFRFRADRASPGHKTHH